MSQFETDFAASAGPMLTGYFGESVVYTPKGGSPVTIQAIVNRQPLTPDGQRVSYRVEIMVDRADVPVLNINGDQVTLKERITDASAKTFNVSHLLPDGQIGGKWRLGLN